MKRIKIILPAVIVMMILSVFPAFCATAPRISVPPEVEEKGFIVFAYENPPHTTMKTPEQGILGEILREALKSAEELVTLDVMPVKMLMKYSLIQDQGLAAVGRVTDFTKDELKQLTEIPCYTQKNTQFSIFINKQHKKGEALAEFFRKNLEKMKQSGKLMEIVKKYRRFTE